jgi:hypothetical protein
MRDLIGDGKEEISGTDQRLHISSSGNALRIPKPLRVCCRQQIVH